MRRMWMVGMGLCAWIFGGCGGGDAPSKPGETSTGAAAQTTKASGSAAPTQAKAPGGKATGPLASLSGVAKTLNDGFAAWMGGKDGAAAFPGWDVKVDEKLMADVKAAGAASGVHAFMEFELIFEKGGKDVYYLRTGVLSSDAVSVFVQLAGREPEGGKVEVASQALDGYTGPGAPFKESADALLKMLQGPECTKVPMGTAEDLGSVIPKGPVYDELDKGLQAGKGNVESVCKAIAGLGSDKVRLRIDDQTFLAKDASGAVVGSIRGGFEAKPGKIEYRMSRFRAMK